MKYLLVFVRLARIFEKAWLSELAAIACITQKYRTLGH